MLRRIPEISIQYLDSASMPVADGRPPAITGWIENNAWLRWPRMTATLETEDLPATYEAAASLMEQAGNFIRLADVTCRFQADEIKKMGGTYFKYRVYNKIAPIVRLTAINGESYTGDDVSVSFESTIFNFGRAVSSIFEGNDGFLSLTYRVGGLPTEPIDQLRAQLFKTLFSSLWQARDMYADASLVPDRFNPAVASMYESTMPNMSL